jgi:hypothetical protein
MSTVSREQRRGSTQFAPSAHIYKDVSERGFCPALDEKPEDPLILSENMEKVIFTFFSN